MEFGDQEASVRRMVDFIGEPFDATCLKFHENRRYDRTASYAQVTEKLYDRTRAGAEMSVLFHRGESGSQKMQGIFWVPLMPRPYATDRGRMSASAGMPHSL